jgi:hypothetical protein
LAGTGVLKVSVTVSVLLADFVAQADSILCK